MIKLTKLEEPEVLKQNKETWRTELLDALENGNKDEIATKRRRYNHPQIKSRLKEETSEKCAYCEAKVTDVAHGDIEHITPKSKDASLTFEWVNLTFSCQVCNQRKSNKEGVLDPYKEDPNDHLFFAGPLVKGKSAQGVSTVLVLDLNRAPLIESRNREIERYANELQQICLLEDQALKDLVFQSLLTDLESRKPEFIAACRQVIKAYQE
ncbi:HNH endonuclease [Shimia sp.]|uniref:HNH endonuclease n=1 Tax=Shimia sp. TaxID=1954381 RepID=UPI003BA9E142